MRPTDVLLLLAAVARAVDDVEQKVTTIVASLTRQEKLELLNGVGWDQWDIRDGYYVGDGAQIARHRRDARSTAWRSHRLIRAQVGNLNGAPAKGLPPLKMHDAGQGFRTHDPRVVGTVTSWPCALALASTSNCSSDWA